MKKISLNFILILITLSCKKNNSNPYTGSSGSNSTGGYYAILTTAKMQSLFSGTLTASFNSVGAYFSSTPATSTNPSTAVTVNQVSLNGTVLKYSTSSYSDTTFSITYPPINWTVNGANGIPTFTFTNTNPMPAFTGYSSWPDTIYRNQNATVQMAGVSGADLITVIITDQTHSVLQQMSLTGTSVNFSSSQLSGLTATNSGALVVALDKSNAQNINGKPMNFLNAYQLTKAVVLK
jgi:hypothetical protein